MMIVLKWVVHFIFVNTDYFGHVVEGTGSFIEDQNVGVIVVGLGNADTLVQAKMEEDAVFTDRGIVTLRQFFDNEIITVGNLCSPDYGDTAYIPLRLSEGDIAGNGVDT